MTFVVKGDFFGKFKTGDNIQYNLSVLAVLYKIYENQNTKDNVLYLKPITIILVSIIEAILHDFHSKVRTNVNEGVIGLADSVVNYIRRKEIDEFGKYIESSKRHDLFDLDHTDFYKKLDDLRIIRNRIHIQNKWGSKPENEYDVFTSGNKDLAELCLEVVVKTMHRDHPRPDQLKDYVGNLTFPFTERRSR